MRVTKCSGWISGLIVACMVVVGLVEGQDTIGKVYHRVDSHPHSLSPPYFDKHLSNRFWDYGGNTFIRNDRFVRLTGDTPGESGWISSKLPALPDNFQFRLHGKGNSMYGDGFALWITDQVVKSGPVFGASDNFKGLGIFFDTYKNNRPGKTFPYVMAMLGDGNTPYDREHDGLANEIAACSARGLHNNPQEVSKARVTYVKGQFLALDLDYKGQDKWENCFEVHGVDIERPSFLGFSAQTGELSEAHDLYNVKVLSLRNPPKDYKTLREFEGGNFESLYVAQADATSPGNTGSKKQASKGGWGFFSKVFLLIIVAIGGYYGYKFYKNKQRQAKSKDYII